MITAHSLLRQHDPAAGRGPQDDCSPGSCPKQAQRGAQPQLRVSSGSSLRSCWNKTCRRLLVHPRSKLLPLTESLLLPGHSSPSFLLHSPPSRSWKSSPLTYQKAAAPSHFPQKGLLTRLNRLISRQPLVTGPVSQTPRPSQQITAGLAQAGQDFGPQSGRCSKGARMPSRGREQNPQLRKALSLHHTRARC